MHGILYLSGAMQVRQQYVYGKDGKKSVVVGYLLEVPEDETEDKPDEELQVCPVCGWILRKNNGEKA